MSEFDTYVNQVQQAFFPMECRLTNDTEAPFSIRIASQAIGNLRFAEIITANAEAGDICSARDNPEIRDEFVLCIYLSGTCRQTQFGRTVNSDRTALSLIHSQSRFHSERGNRTSSLFVIIPGDVLRQAVPYPEDLCAKPILCGDGVGSIFRTFLNSVWQQRSALGERTGTLISDEVLSLFSACASHSQSQPPSRVRREIATKERVLSFIEDNLFDPDLTPTAISQAMGISSGHLHRLFRPVSTTIGRLIMDKRLNAAGTMLARNDLTHLSITEIALRCGFYDSSHFSRSFSRKFAHSPRSWRHRGNIR